MGNDPLYLKEFQISGGDFDKAGEVSTKIKSILKSAGIDSTVIRRVAIASYEAEMNVVIHATNGRTLSGPFKIPAIEYWPSTGRKILLSVFVPHCSSASTRCRLPPAIPST